MIGEKRFGYGETDLFEWVEDNGEMISTKECVNKLNEQQATISRLKEENEKFIQNKCLPCELVSLQTKEIDKLKDENEKLKKENNGLKGFIKDNFREIIV